MTVVDGFCPECGVAAEGGVGYHSLRCPRVPRPAQLFVDVHGLEPDAIRVVERVVERLRLGQRQYGPLVLATNPRDWKAEAVEELLDATAYLAMQSVKERG